MKAVEAWQKRKIYAIAGSLKFVDKNDKENDILHMIVYNLTMKTSVKDLTFAQANLVIDYLVQQQNKSIPEVMMQNLISHQLARDLQESSKDSLKLDQLQNIFLPIFQKKMGIDW